MCEPNHSITQVPPQDPGSGMPTDQVLGLGNKPNSLLKRIWRWLHFSRMGHGHSESIVASSFTDQRLNAIGRASYEAQWWDRKFRRDFGLYASDPVVLADLRSQEAFEAANEYANRVSIGGLTQLRTFLSASVKSSDRPLSYLEMFRLMLNANGAAELDKRLPLIKELQHRQRCIEKASRDKLVNLMLGFTRKRNLLVPEWADDSKLWTPKPA